MKILVSACLLGEKCKYDGGSNFNETVAAFCRGKEVIAVCPEISSGMGSPRVPAEIVNGKVTDKMGKTWMKSTAAVWKRSWRRLKAKKLD